MKTTERHQEFIDAEYWLRQRIADAEQELANHQRKFVEGE